LPHGSRFRAARRVSGGIARVLAKLRSDVDRAVDGIAWSGAMRQQMIFRLKLGQAIWYMKGAARLALLMFGNLVFFVSD
jgi:hypothetical protein